MGVDPDTVDATRRTRLAAERTYLAWWRSGLTALAVSLGAGRLLPELTGGARWPYIAIGAAFSVLGAVFIGYGALRQLALERAFRDGRFAPLADRAAVVLSVVGVLLAVAVTLLVLLES